MAELVDAPASGAGARKGVEVRVLFWAPFSCIDEMNLPFGAEHQAGVYGQARTAYPLVLAQPKNRRGLEPVIVPFRLTALNAD